MHVGQQLPWYQVPVLINLDKKRWRRLHGDRRDRVKDVLRHYKSLTIHCSVTNFETIAIIPYWRLTQRYITSAWVTPKKQSLYAILNCIVNILGIFTRITSANSIHHNKLTIRAIQNRICTRMWLSCVAPILTMNSHTLIYISLCVE